MTKTPFKPASGASEPDKTAGHGLTGQDKQQDGLRDTNHGARDGGVASPDTTPEGLRRERKGPLNPTTGRAKS